MLNDAQYFILEDLSADLLYHTVFLCKTKPTGMTDRQYLQMEDFSATR